MSLISNFFLTNKQFKSFSLLTSSTGEVCYVPTSNCQKLFSVIKLKSFSDAYLSKILTKHSYLSKYINIANIFSLICQLPKYKPVNSLEIYPLKGSQYVLSPGSKSFITKVDIINNVVIVKLPSGVSKVFSAYAVGLQGIICYSQKQIKSPAKAGFLKVRGKKSLSRGVAKNPVDHPHGGRNKAIKYQRTP